MRSISLLQLFVGIVAGLVFLAGTPLYSEPFGGCQIRGFATFELGCSLWPDFLYGLSFVLLVGLIGPNQLRPHLWALAVVLVIALLGGPESIRTGMHLNLWSQPADLMFYWRGPGLAIFLGGLLASGLFALLSHIVRKLRKESRNVPNA